MRKLINILGVTALILSLVSCQKHEFAFVAHDVPDTYAQFQLHTFVPIANVAANYITRVEFNDKLFSKDNFAPYNGLPSGAVGKFFAVPSGSVNIKLYMIRRYRLDQYTGADRLRRDTVTSGGVDYVNVDSLVFDKSVTLAAKRYNVFVTNYNSDPIVVEHPDPYLKGIANVDTLSYFCFGNFLFGNDGVTPVGTMRLMLRSRLKDTTWNPDGTYIADYTYEKIGEDIPFGTLSPWIWLPVRRAKNSDGSYSVANQGYETRYFKIMIVNSDNTLSDLPYWISTSSQGTYTDYWSWYIGRRYIWFLGGLSATTRSNQIFSGTRWTLL